MCDAQGCPRWWRHYVYGLSWLGREHVRQQLTAAQSSRLANTATDAFIGWQHEQLMLIQPQESYGR